MGCERIQPIPGRQEVVISKAFLLSTLGLVPLGGRLASRRAGLWVGAGLAVLIGAIVVVIVIVTGGSKPPEVFGPWYPPQNSDGDAAAADFENHVPCALDPVPAGNCQRIKLGVVLYRNTAGEPTTYLISIVRVGVGNDRETHEGTWTVGQGTGLDPEATVYRFDSSAPDHLRAFWPIGDDILFLLDQSGMPRVGDAAYGYALNSVPIGREVRAPN